MGEADVGSTVGLCKKGPLFSRWCREWVLGRIITLRRKNAELRPDVVCDPQQVPMADRVRIDVSRPEVWTLPRLESVFGASST